MIHPLQALASLGQSPWLDNIERRLLVTGELARLIQQGEIRGVTSNPSIFHNVIARSSDYDDLLSTLTADGCSPEEIYDHLVLRDICEAADLFLPLYELTQSEDGYVSLEVNPLLAQDSDSTLQEAQRLWNKVNRPNLMIKIPATREGLTAIRGAIAKGINVNVTLIFSLKRYLEVMDAYLIGLEDRLEKGQTILEISSVASFFISRLDTKADKLLATFAHGDSAKAALAVSLSGKLAIANAKMAYQQFKQVFSSERFKFLESHGGRVQRPLWASTSAKNPAYPDTYYVEPLIGPHTVNTMPPVTLAAFKDHGVAKVTVEDDVPGAQMVFSDLEALGISIANLTQELENEGVSSFVDSYQALIKTIEQRRLVALQQG